MVAVLLLSALAVPSASAGTVHYTDDFDDGNADGWTPISGDWSVIDGEYHQTSLSTSNGGATPWGADMLTSCCSVTDSYTAEVDLRLLDAPSSSYVWWGIMFNYQNPQNHELVTLHKEGTHTSLEYWTYTFNPEAGRSSWHGVSSVVVGSSSTTYPYEVHRLGVTVDGVDLQFTLDGNVVLEATTTTGFTGGLTGLYTEYASAAFDNWAVAGLSIADSIANLIATVEGLNLSNGISNSLDAKLDNAVKALDDVNESNDVAAVNKIEAFIKEVEAQAGNQLPQSDADALIAAAQQIIDLLTGG